MGKVVFNNSVPLDGFVAGPDDEVDRLFGWYSSGDTEIPVQEGGLVLKGPSLVSEGVAHAVREAKQRAGNKHVALSSATIMRRFLRAGLFDERHSFALRRSQGGGDV